MPSSFCQPTVPNYTRDHRYQRYQRSDSRSRGGLVSSDVQAMRKIRTYHEVDAPVGDSLVAQVDAQRARLNERLSIVRTVVAVASGKGGVGKSAITANLAAALAVRGFRVGALDADLNGPSLARMLAVSGKPLGDADGGIVPPQGVGGVRVMSMELLQHAEDAPLRWRGPAGDRFIWQSTLETGVLREFVSDVEWGPLDFLLIDVPPGTDKIDRLLTLIPGLDRFLMVTTPAEIARAVVLRALTQVGLSGVAGVGIVANMTEYVCPDCDARHPLFPGDGAERLARASQVDIWARIPFDPALGAATDQGCPPALDQAQTGAAREIGVLADHIVAGVGS